MTQIAEEGKTLQEPLDLTALPGYVPGFHDALNLRELGGQMAADGRTVKHGLLYRSGALCNVTPVEQVFLDKLGLRFILDLRAEKEVIDKPDPIVQGARQIRICGCMDASDNEIDLAPASILNLLRNPRRIDEDEEESVESGIAELYSSLAFDNIAYRELFEQLECGNVPLLFHCTAGKDRTGIASMLILLALGASDETILADYTLTNDYRREVIEERLEDHPFLANLDAVELLIRAGFGVVERFGARVLDEIKQEYGTYEVYFEQEFGLDSARLAALRDRYLE